ncbi:prepilin-type N-terminal cleavage/methylation domain-containing protein [candidate division KSB1 bacterium]
MGKNKGFTLMELVIVVVILGFLAAVAIPKFSGIVNDSRINAVKSEMQEIEIAIVGDAAVVSGGVSTHRGYFGDTGHMPAQLMDLINKPASDSTWDRSANNGIGSGWNGPYVRDDGTGAIFTDVWGNPYILTATTLKSYGPNGTDDGGTGDDIVLNLQ